MKTGAFYFVVKASKLCNLRCTYCYEFAELAIKDVMREETLGRLFDEISSFACHIRSLGIEPKIHIVWHGGEPLLVDTAFFSSAIHHQNRALGGECVSNYIQTNLYKVKTDRLNEVRRLGFKISVSIDFSEGTRVSLYGNESNGIAMSAAETLRREGFEFGVISVIGRHNANKIASSYDWVSKFAESWRLLPVFSGGPTSSANLYLSPEEIASAFLRVFEERLVSDIKIGIEPIDTYFNFSVSDLVGAKIPKPNINSLENVYVINVNGDVFLRPFAYNSNYILGNVNSNTFSEMTFSMSYRNCKDIYVEAYNRNCSSCRISDVCDRSPISEHGNLSNVNGVDLCVFPAATASLFSELLLKSEIPKAEIMAMLRSNLTSHLQV